MKRIKRYRIEIIAATAIVIGYIASRLTNILSLPIFTDEAIYTRWAQIAKYDASWRFISLTDGKQPSYIWLHMLTIPFFDDPLLAGRIVSVGAGLVTMIGLFLLTRHIFKNNRVALLSSFLYAIYPFALVYDRLGLYESTLGMFFVWTLYLELLLVRYLRLDIALLLGFSLGGAMLTKTSGFLAMYMMPLLFGLLDFGKKKAIRIDALKLLGLLLVSVVVASAMYSVLRLSPFNHIIDEKNTIFVYPLSEWLKFTFMDKINHFLSNMRGLVNWFFIYFSVPFLTFVIIGLFSKSAWREKLLLGLWFLLPFLALGVVGKTIYPRFIFFMTLPLLPLVAYGFVRALAVTKNKIFSVCLMIALVAYPLFVNYYILFDISRAPIPKLDLEQLVNGWPAGGGIRESIEFFEQEAQDRPIMVATQGTFGLLPAAYEIYMMDNPNVEIKAYWPVDATIPEDVLMIAEEKPVYFVFYQDCSACKYPGAAPETWPLEKIISYQKGIGETELSIYKVTQP